jgi:subtilase family serine protease
MDWRDEQGITKFVTYKKKFAWRPILTIENEKLWWVNYYVVYNNWTSTLYSHSPMANGHIPEYTNTHSSKAGLISEADYLVRKLAESL